MSDNLQLQTESIHSPVTSGGKMSTTRSKREKCHRHQKASQNWPVSLWDTAEVMFSPVEIATNWWDGKPMQKKVKSHIVNHHLFLVTIFCANEIILKFLQLHLRLTRWPAITRGKTSHDEMSAVTV